MKKLKIWCISDTHGEHDELVVPENIDMVIFAGDAANYSNYDINKHELNLFFNWFTKLDIKYRVIIGGNHDGTMELKTFIPPKGVHYLQHESIEIEGIKIFGSPYTPEFNNWFFNRTDTQLVVDWKIIPEDTDILITHGPPRGILDLCGDDDKYLIEVGCEHLKSEIFKKQPKYHIFGHIHTQGGKTQTSLECSTIFINAAVVNDSYNIINNGHIIDYE